MPKKPAKPKKPTTKATSAQTKREARIAAKKAQQASLSTQNLLRSTKTRPIIVHHDEARQDSPAIQQTEAAETSAPSKPGPAPELFKIEGMTWQDAIKKSLTKQKPPGGWPKMGRGM